MKVLITGTSLGIGKDIALKFLEENHEVIGFDILDSTINHKNYKHYNVDILNSNLPEIKNIDILINNAGVQLMNELDIDINLKGTIRITENYAFQDNIKSVLFIASASASSGSEFLHYAASKGGMLAYMKNVAIRIAKYKATSNSLSPGGVITDLNKHILESDTLYKKCLDETLLKSWSTSREIAEFAYFMTVINKSMTAQDLLIDNGEAANFNFIW